MNSRLICLSIALLTLVTPLTAQDNKEGIDFKEIHKELLEDAKRVYQSEKPQNDWDRRLRGVEVTEDNLNNYLEALQQPLTPDLGAYVMHQLLRPLVRAETQVAQKALPVVQRSYAAHARFQELPKLTASIARAIQLPEYKANQRDDQAMRELMQAVQRRNQFLLRYEKVRLHNLYAEELVETYAKLVLRHGDKRSDSQLVSMIREYNDQDLATFSKIVSAVGDESENLTKQRAEAFYDLFTDIGGKFRLETRKYHSPGEVGVDKIGQASFGQDSVNVGQLFLEAADDLAKKHGFDRVNVPSRNDIREYQQKQRDRRRRNR
jgi:hypothetical protein